MTALALTRPAGAVPSGEGPPVAPDPALARHLAAACAAVEAATGGGLARRLFDWLTHAPKEDISPLRPRPVARALSVPPERLAEACLHACKMGAMAMHWRLFCNSCGSVAMSAETPSDLPSQCRCEACGEVCHPDFADNVDLTFRLEGWLHRGLMPHGPDVGHRPLSRLAPGQTRGYRLPRERRVRLLLVRGDRTAASVDVPPGGPHDLAVGDALLSCRLDEDGGLGLSNVGAHECALRVFAVEGAEHRLTAQRALTIQAFRDLFPAMGGNAGFGIPVGEVTLLFTDLMGSTRLYRTIGDLRAYEVVRQHFLFLRDIVTANGGAFLKTMGDGSMSAFPSPAHAVRAALAVQARLSDFNAAHQEPDLIVRKAVHVGACVAVMANGQVDYFGSTVNLMGRLLSQSQGELILSRDAADAPGVTALLAGLDGRADECVPNGLDAPVAFVRVTSRADAGLRRLAKRAARARAFPVAADGVAAPPAQSPRR